MQTDTLIIGSGIAGATAALKLAEDRQRQITLLTRAEIPTESNTYYAQGGIVGRGLDDTAEILIDDIIKAGAGLSNPQAVLILANEGPRLIDEILFDSSGLEFDHDPDGKLVFGLEGAHSRQRILHVGDATGRAIMIALMAQVKNQPNINIMTAQTVVDLITFPHHALDPLAIYEPVSCHGAYVFDQTKNEVYSLLASHTILATGGLGQIYLNTTNPPGSRGDGLAMAYRAGARVVNTEYIQFHPTALSLPGVHKFLISEAVRGEGATLLTPKGEPFMERYAPEWKDLAPRDIVARAIYWEMLENDYPHVWLDIATRKPSGFIRKRFPQIYTTCLKQDLDITQQPIPVVPAAHYFCGGVLVDLWGNTSLDGLYAIGEVSCTGIHGANRLASTSLLEGLVWGARAAWDIQKRDSKRPISEGDVPAWDISGLAYDADPALIQGDMQTIRNLMWHYVGLVRSEYRLRRAIRNLQQLWLDIEEFYRKTRLTDGLIGLRNSIQNALIVARSARQNRVSRGSHYRNDSLDNKMTQ
ncbi:MAG: L-aspartate oxidase [Chloroflexi bacterium]|nr:L-aspartate oxidase [Chloroflexota bacterium]